MRYFKLFAFSLLILSCVEPYEFAVSENSPSLVVESYISDRSFLETTTYPSDGRFFTVKLSYTSDVTNVRPTVVNYAAVKLIDDAGHEWSYQEAHNEPGSYVLYDQFFEAEQNKRYKLRIAVLQDVYESEWEALPSIEIPPIGEIGFRETERQVYIVEANKPVLRTIKEISTHIKVPQNVLGEEIFYRWEFVPMWIYRAPLSSSSQPGHICWATDINYINTYTIQNDNIGGYSKELFSMPTIRNERIFEDLSILVIQFASTEEYYNFWKEMHDQNEGSTLIDTPPYNLRNNFKSLTNEKRVSGYFGVVKEQARRWYFNRKDLSYNVVNTLKTDCLVDYGPGGPAPECTNCLEYSFGKTTNVKPMWWRKE